MSSRDLNRTPRSHRDLQQPTTPESSKHPRSALQKSHWASPKVSSPPSSSDKSTRATDDNESDEELTPRGRPPTRGTHVQVEEIVRGPPLPKQTAGSYAGRGQTFERDARGSSSPSLSMATVPSWMSSGQILAPGGLSASTKAYNNAPDDNDKAESEFGYFEEGVTVNKNAQCTCPNAYDDNSADEEMPGQGSAFLPKHKSCSCSPMRRQHEWEERQRREQEVLSPFPDFDENKAKEVAEKGEQYFLMPIGKAQPEERIGRPRR